MKRHLKLCVHRVISLLLFLPFLISLDLLASTADAAEIEWPAYGYDKTYTRHSPAKIINKNNIKNLKLAWSIRSGEDEPYTAVRTFANTPLMVNDSLFACTPDEDLIALDPITGSTKWRFDFSEFNRDRSVVRGNCWSVVYHQRQDSNSQQACHARLLHVTQMGELIAVDANSGKLCKDFGENGFVKFRAADEELFGGEIYNVTVPVIVGDTVAVGNSPADGLRTDGPKGYIRAFNVLSGELQWKFRPIPGPEDEVAYKTWAPGSAEKTGAANVWSGFSADSELGIVYAPVATVAPDYYGGERLGDNLYANSLIALDADSGKRLWHFQTVHHDIWDYDLPTPPLLVDLTIKGENRKAAIQLTKMGMVFTFDRQTGEPLFAIEERPVPQSAAPGDVVSKTQPFPVAPPPLVDHSIDFNNLYGPTPEHKKQCQALVEGMPEAKIYTPISTQGIIQVPGALGGSNWGGATFDPQRQVLIAPVMNLPLVMRLTERFSLDWFSELLGELASLKRPIFMPLFGTPYSLHGKPFAAEDGTPCVAPPWFKLVALNMSTGTILWQAPILSESTEDAKVGRHISLGGAISTGGGVVFIAATPDKMFRAFDTDTGKLLWQYQLPATGNATPMSYEIDGKQYIVISAGGSDLVGSERADYIMAFSLHGI